MTTSRPHRPINQVLRVKLSRFREMLQLEKDFAEISEYFHTVLVPDDDFIAASNRSSSPRLLQAIQGVLGSIAPGGALTCPLVLRLESERMCHGYASWGRGHALFFYFEALDMGFCSFSRSLMSSEVVFARFTLTPSAASIPWSAAPRGSA